MAQVGFRVGNPHFVSTHSVLSYMELSTFFKQFPITDIAQGTESAYVLRGLQTGEYIRCGGIIRKSPGSPEGGQIVAHLRDIYSDAPQDALQNAPLGAPQPPSPGGAGAMAKTLQLSQVAAAANVLNLGVSIVGFAYMAKRMNDLQRDLAGLDRKLDQRFDRVDDQLEEVLIRLDEIRYVMHANHAQGAAIREEVRAVRDALFGAQKGRLMAALEMVDIGESTLEANLQTFKEVRHALEEELYKPPSFRGAERLVDVGVRFRVWAIAAASEALALVRLDMANKAAEQYHDHGVVAHKLSRAWVQSALPEGDWTIWAHSRFDDTVSEERLYRVARTQHPGRSTAWLRSEKSSGAIRNDAYVSRLTGSQKAMHDSAATLADAAAEIGDRFHSNAKEIRQCARSEVSVEQWQKIGASSDQPLLLLPVQRDWT